MTLDELYAEYFERVFLAIAEGARGREAEYRKWVKAFYEGNWSTTGWVSQTEQAVSSNGEEIRAPLNTLGQRLCGEWAKPNRIRAVSTADLKRWAGDPEHLSLDGIQSLIGEVESRLPQPLIPAVEYDRLEI